MADDQLQAARDALRGAIFYEMALSLGGVSLMLQAQDRTDLRLNAEAVADAGAPVPDDRELGALNARLVELVTPLFGAEVADLRRREDNAYQLVFADGAALSLLRSSDDRITDNVVSIHGPNLIFLLE